MSTARSDDEWLSLESAAPSCVELDELSEIGSDWLPMCRRARVDCVFERLSLMVIQNGQNDVVRTQTNGRSQWMYKFVLSLHTGPFYRSHRQKLSRHRARMLPRAHAECCSPCPSVPMYRASVHPGLDCTFSQAN